MASTPARCESYGFLPVGLRITLGYTATVDNEGVFHHSIVDVCQIVGNYSDTFELKRRSMRRHADACVESHAGHFQQL
jgi:hypothetical protein